MAAVNATEVLYTSPTTDRTFRVNPLLLETRGPYASSVPILPALASFRDTMRRAGDETALVEGYSVDQSGPIQLVTIRFTQRYHTRLSGDGGQFPYPTYKSVGTGIGVSRQGELTRIAVFGWSDWEELRTYYPNQDQDSHLPGLFDVSLKALAEPGHDYRFLYRQPAEDRVSGRISLTRPVHEHLPGPFMHLHVASIIE